jgi:uncharacterized membrane protein
MPTYTIIGGDHQEYRDITENQVRQWIFEGRLNAQSLAKGEGDTQWRPLAQFPEFAEVLAAQAAAPLAPTGFAPSAACLERDYDLDIGGCVSRGWNLFWNNVGLLLMAALIYLLIEGMIALLGAIPFIGPLFSIANLLIVGPLLGGLYYVFIRTIRGQPAEIGDVFAGFGKSFIQLFLGHLIPALLAGLCLIPAAIFAALLMLPAMLRGNHFAGGHPDVSPALLAILAGVFLVSLVPLMFLSVCWMFTVPLIIDRQMQFWPAMQASWKKVTQHWWHVFGLALVIGLVNVGGFLLCCVGMLFTAPIGIAAMMYAYETIFSESPSV